MSWHNIILLLAPSLNIIFAPHCYRRSDGTWHTEKDIKQSVLFDRLRLINALRGNAEQLGTLPSFTLLTTLLQQKEDIV
jgi:hypothetical protein